jgi:ATP-binding cassette subfamily B protein
MSGHVPRRPALPSIRDAAPIKALRLLVEASPRLAVLAALFVIAEGALPNLVIVAMGHATGAIPGAVEHGIGSSAGTRLLVGLAVAGGVYALSLLRGPIEDALSAAVRTRLALVLQRRIVAAVCAPAGIAHLEDPDVLDRLASATGELRGDQVADAPMTLLSLTGDRLGGLLSCVVLATFRLWVGALLLVVWLAVRRPARAFVVSRVTTFRRATAGLRQANYLLGLTAGAAGAKEVRVFGLPDWLLTGFRTRWLTAMEPSWGELRVIDRRIARIGLVVLAAYVASAGALGWAAYHHEIGLRTLATMLPMLPMSMALGSITATDLSLASMLVALPDVESLTRDLTAAAPAPTTGSGATDRPAEAVRFEHVRFRYPGGTDDVLHDLDLTLTAGSSLALVGLNGAGKTTLVTLLARLHEPTGGRITVDGLPLAALDAPAWQRQIAVVSQEPLRLPLSARENVTLAGLRGEPHDEDALATAAERAGATAVVAGLEHGWDTILSPRYAQGTDLSGGQWQRIALARALYAVARGARVLVLDEPTAQLDVRAEAAFYDRFLELTAGTTSIVISHRFSTVRRADRIAVLDGGAIAELGGHDALVASGGEYARLFALQAEAFTAGSA